MKNKIQEVFILARKAKNNAACRAISGLKSDIEKAEKIDNRELTNQEIQKIIVKAVKQREDSVKIYKEQNRQDLLQKEQEEVEVLNQFLPSKLSSNELKSIIEGLLSELNQNLPAQAKTGRIIGTINKQYPGQADINEIKKIVQTLIK